MPAVVDPLVGLDLDEFVDDLRAQRVGEQRGGGLVIEHAPVHITHGGADQRGCKIPRTKR